MSEEMSADGGVDHSDDEEHAEGIEHGHKAVPDGLHDAVELLKLCEHACDPVCVIGLE